MIKHGLFSGGTISLRLPRIADGAVIMLTELIESFINLDRIFQRFH